MLLGKHQMLVLNQLKMLAAINQGKQLSMGSAAGTLLEILQRAIQFDAAWVLRFDPLSMKILDIYLHQFSQKAFSKYLDSFYNHGPITTITEIKNKCFVSKRGSDLIENSAWMDHPFYKEILQPMGLKFFLQGICINRRLRSIGLVVLWRSKDRTNFSSGDCLLLEKASNYFATALSRIKPMEVNSEKHQILRLLRQRSFPGIIVMNKKDEIVFINSEADDLLTMASSGNGQLLRSEDERLLSKLQQLKAKALKNLALQGQGHGIPSIFEIFTFRGTTYSLRGVPMERDGKNRGLVMILIETIKQHADSLPALNNYVSGLTGVERAAARLISRGLANKEIARELGIGIYTVKDHIKKIMAKLKTNTRSGIVAKIVAR